MSRFAEKTSVTSDKSRAEIERTLSRYGATGFMYGWGAEHALVAFEMGDRRVKFELPMPDRADRKFRYTPAQGRLRSDSQIEAAYEQAVKQRWRALALVIKAKLEAVESGITIFDEEFLAHIVMPNGLTIGKQLVPQLGTLQELPPLLGHES